MPNFTIIIILSFALLRGSTEGGVIGFFAGLLYDIQFGEGIGFHAILGMYLGILAGKTTVKFYRESYLLPFVLSIGSVFIYEHVVYVLQFLFRGNLNYINFIKQIIFPELIYTSVLVPLLYRLIWEINYNLERKQQKKF